MQSLSRRMHGMHLPYHCLYSPYQGIYLDVSSVGFTVARNLVYDVGGSGFHWNVNPGVEQPMANPAFVRGNVFVLDRDTAFYRGAGKFGSPAVTWHSHAPAW